MSKWSSRTSDQFIWLVLENKTKAVKACLIKNSKGEGVGGGNNHTHTHTHKGGGGGGWEIERGREGERQMDKEVYKTQSRLEVYQQESDK